MTEIAECKRCGYRWQKRKKEPKACPECKSRLWREPKPEDMV